MAEKVGILGSGQVAQRLAQGFVQKGYAVCVGTRDQDKLSQWLTKSGLAVTLGSFEEAAAFGDIIVLAVRGTAAEELVQKLASRLSGKTVIDATNPISNEPPENGVLRFFTQINKSLMEILQQSAPDARFVKAFNSVGNALMVDPATKGGKPTMFICGNDDQAKQEVRRILEQFGWEVEDLGKVEAARAIEPLCMLWCVPGFLRNQWNHAFKLVTT